MYHFKVFSNVLFLIGFLFVVNCAFLNKEYSVAPVENRTADGIYESALKKSSEKQYKDALTDLEEIDSLYPFSPVAIKARIMMSFLNYELRNYARSATYAEDYINLYPDGEDIDFAYYLRIMANYMQINDVERDQSAAYKVSELLEEFIHLFPNSQYLAEVNLRLNMVNEHIAAKEFSVGKFYLQRGEYVAAIRRFSTILKRYKDTKYFPESVYRTAEAYLSLGDKDAYSKYMSLLKECCANSDWYTLSQDRL
ncbi:outer membrane protein assembly factor BamD [Ehrlichia ruminantium]|uniref:Outer membrane protein assembly factor BamD n=1 Tax=Ehrlichia ruminantium TaxID=779 RepID=A0AAE6QAL5_EHRRU|nr:outer membrane protein assembly factor BamD [Ehrlichia ruminantium]QGR02845.1 outer membrane protein assembly factor BamD [Ehrlichia ruminantium]QGR03769.1 outer membrane protein assembly factor BamD [Ehrlichia ruminantium]QGR04696.1 outer membrane protein assembly factor BamD [Ehrlichia ruminantium]